MSEKRFFNSYFTEHIIDKKTDKCYPVRYVGGVYELTDLLNELAEELNTQQATIDMQELRLQQLEELLELSENLNKSYREKLIDMNLKMVIEDE